MTRARRGTALSADDLLILDLVPRDEALDAPAIARRAGVRFQTASVSAALRHMATLGLIRVHRIHQHRLKALYRYQRTDVSPTQDARPPTPGIRGARVRGDVSATLDAPSVPVSLPAEPWLDAGTGTGAGA